MNNNMSDKIKEEKREKERDAEMTVLNNLLINLYKKQNKYLQELKYEKIIPFSLVSPSIDLLNIGSYKLAILITKNQIDMVRFELNKYFFEPLSGVIINSSTIQSRIKYLNKNSRLNPIMGFKYYLYEGSIYAFRETYSKYLIDEKDFAQVLYQFDCLDNYNKHNIQITCKTSNYRSSYTIPINKTFSNNTTPTVLNTNDFSINIHDNIPITKISDSLANTSKINRFLLEIPMINNIYQNDYNIVTLDVGQIIPTIIKYRDSDILGFNLKIKNNTYSISKKSEDKIISKDSFNHMLFIFMFMFQRIMKNKYTDDFDIYSMLTYNFDDYESDNDNIVRIIGDFNLYKSYFNNIFFKELYYDNILKKSQFSSVHYYGNIIKQFNMEKNVKINNIVNMSKPSIASLIKNVINPARIKQMLLSDQVICSDNTPNWGFIIQINTGNNIYEPHENINKKLFTNFNNIKHTKKGMKIHESFQSENPTYACVYFDNASNKTYYYSPTIEKPKTLIDMRLAMMNFDSKNINLIDKMYIENEMAHLKFDDTIIPSNFNEYLNNFNLMSRDINDIKPDKSGGLLDTILSNTGFRLSDLSGLYCLYFLVAMSSNMPDHDNKPISSSDNPFADYFDKVFRHFDDDIFKVENNKQKQRNSYIKHVQNVSNMIGDLLFIQNNSTFDKYDNKVKKYKEDKKELNDTLLKKIFMMQ
jgi:hypothetical protein